MKEGNNKQRRKVINEIDKYLIKRENDGDREARVLHLLSAAKEVLKEMRGGKEGNKINIILSTLKSIQQKLTRVKEQGISAQKAKKTIIYITVT